jgi:hypothetical protein
LVYWLEIVPYAFRAFYIVWQGKRSEKVGIIDAEPIVHQGIPSLGGPRLQKVLDLSHHIVVVRVRRASSKESIAMMQFLLYAPPTGPRCRCCGDAFSPSKSSSATFGATIQL